MTCLGHHACDLRGALSWLHRPGRITVGRKLSRPLPVSDFEQFDAQIGHREWLQNEAIHDFVQSAADALCRALAASCRNDDRAFD